MSFIRFLPGRNPVYACSLCIDIWHFVAVGNKLDRLKYRKTNMEDKQQLRQSMPLTSLPTLLALGILLSVVLVLGLLMTADYLRYSLHLPTTNTARPLNEREATTLAPGLKAVEVTGEHEAETAASGVQLLLETPDATENLSAAATEAEGALTCGELGTDKACTSGGKFLNLLPPDAADSANRKTLLLLGVDSRGGGLISRTDTIMLLSLDEDSDQISLLSIPRDLYVTIAGHGRDRINTALVYGAQDDDLQAGIALLQQTIEQTLDVTIDHHVVVDFRAVVRSIDALGGIDVYVPYEINDPMFPDMNGGFDPLYIPQGQQHFAGEMALKYARTRHQDNDFYRAQRQQQILLAIRQQVLNLGVTDILESAPTLYSQVRQGVFTDFSLVQLVQLGRVMSGIPLDNIHTEVLDDEYVSSTLTEAGEYVLILKPAAASSLIEEIFTN